MGENLVDVEAAALASEAPAPASSPADPAAPGVEDPQPAPIAGGELTPEQIEAIAERNAPATVFLVQQLGAVLAPNWQISRDESQVIGRAAAIALAAWFPSGALPLKWMVLLNLGGSIFGLVDARRDPDTGKLRPLRAEAPRSPASAGQGAAAGAAAAGSGFSTAA